MQNRLAHGAELFRFFLNHGYLMADEEYGQAILCLKEEKDTLFKPVNIPYMQSIARDLLRYILEGCNFTEKEFWEWVENG